LVLSAAPLVTAVFLSCPHHPYLQRHLSYSQRNKRVPGQIFLGKVNHFKGIEASEILKKLWFGCLA
jgi:hypothetical protein